MGTDVAVKDVYEVVPTDVEGTFYVTRNGERLTDSKGQYRTFTSRNSARKRITRERRGNFHL